MNQVFVRRQWHSNTAGEGKKQTKKQTNQMTLYE